MLKPAPQYKVGNSDRVVGDPTSAPEGFYVLNLSNLQGYISHNGVWERALGIPLPVYLTWDIEGIINSPQFQNQTNYYFPLLF